MGGGTGTRKYREQGEMGESRCTSTHTLHNEQSRYRTYLHAVIIHTWGLVCEIQVMDRMCNYTKGLKRLLIRRQLCRSYLSWVNLFHLSCTLITAVI